MVSTAMRKIVLIIAFVLIPAVAFALHRLQPIKAAPVVTGTFLADGFSIPE
jgi:hypothetical protein